MSLDTSRYQLHTALKTVRLRWDDVCDVWNDGVRQDFEKDFWNQVDPAVRSAISAIDRLAVAIGQMKHDCQANESSLHGE